MTTPDLLDLIETLCTHSPAEDVELAIVNKVHPRPTERERQLARTLTKIYTAVHAHTKHSCSHPDWKREAEAAYEDFVKQL